MSHSLVLPTTGSAPVQGDLWGARAADWAEHELQYRPMYEEALDALRVAPGSRLLDLGCGAGVLLAAAADRGLDVSGLDAAAPMLDAARARVPDADLRVGDLESLPYPDDAFDVVTAFNSFWYAADPLAALREARRVTRPGGRVLLLVFGPPERSGLTPMLAAIATLGPAVSGAKFSFHAPGVLEGLAEQAGLRPVAAGALASTMRFADEETLVRQLRSPGPVALAARTSGEAAVREAIVESLAAARRPDGSYVVTTEWRHIVAAA